MRVSATNPKFSLIYSSLLKNFVYRKLVLQEYKTASVNTELRKPIRNLWSGN